MSCIPEMLMLLKPLGFHNVLKEFGSFSSLQWVVSAPCSPSNPFSAFVVPPKAFTNTAELLFGQNMGYCVYIIFCKDSSS